MAQDDINPHFAISKTTAQPQYTLQNQQRYNRSATAPALQTLAFVPATVLVVLVRVCSAHQEM